MHIKNNVFWVGKVDWELRRFHGNEYSTHKGTTYNSYLIKEQKTALIDTVWSPFSKEFIHKLSKEIDLKQIDYVIANHAEIDHSGALAELMSHIPDKPIYCTINGVESLMGHYHKDWNFHPVKSGDILSLGKKELIFVEAPMLHWPDTMFCYLTGDNILFSNDAFGQHYATDLLFNDLVDQAELFTECIKYYANILTPFSKMVNNKIKEFAGLNFPLDIICPSHGVIWRKNPSQIIDKYMQWANSYKENQITIIYDTMWNGTRVMAESIAKGIREADKEVVVRIYNVSKADKNDVITEIFKSKSLVVGSPTINRGILSGVAGILEEIRGLQFKGKKAACFGCYGWSGESVKMLTELLKNAGFEIVDDGIRAMWNPDEDAISKCIDYGKQLA
ncbi:MAG: anaerobic nitric oxide reductase flavorubredoxin [Candidatus Omnitrophota bacterium]